MEVDDDNDSNATVSEREVGHCDYRPIPETINLSPYAPILPYLLTHPKRIPCETSVEVATLIMDNATHIQPLYPQDDPRPDMAAFAFMERLFNMGRLIGKGGHTPMFSSSTGEYKFYTARDRDLAAHHGFINEEQMFKYLDDLKGIGRIPQNDPLRFQCPWHEIDVVFEPRKRGNIEPKTKRGIAAKKAKEEAAAAMKEEDDNIETPPKSPADGDDTLMTNGDDTVLTTSSDIPSGPTPPSGPAPVVINPLTGRPKKPYQAPKRIHVEPITTPICMEDLIHAVTRHPLLLPAEPVSCAFLIEHAPHLLQNVGLLYVLAHGEIENEGLSERLGKMGLDVAPNVLAHRKKKALLDMGGEYKDRKAEYEAYKKALRRMKKMGMAARGSGNWLTG